jgi:hypothetical protein
MGKAKEWSEKMAEGEIFDTNQSRLTKQEMKDEIVKFWKMLGRFDSIFARKCSGGLTPIFAQVHGVEAGLLSSCEH